MSPFATVPLDAGQRKRAWQTTSLLKNLGYHITFLLYAFEEGWKSAANEDWIAQMRDQWDELIVWRAGSKVGMPPTNGPVHDPDEWWDPALEIMLQQLLGYRHFDVFAVHNIWMSKAFDFAPASTVKILDSHDVFSGRRAYFDRMGSAPEFFITDEAREAGAANRADIVLAIQKNDQAWFAQHSKATPLCVPYDPGDAQMPPRHGYLHEDKVVFGFLGSAHIFNIKGLAAYCEELRLAVGRTAAPVEFRIAGAASESIRTRGPWTLCGKVDDEKGFFAGVDVAVVPVFDGSGFKVKVADAAAMGLPILCAEHAAIGTALNRRMLARHPDDLARMTVEIALQRPPYADLQRFSHEVYVDLKARAATAALKLKARIGALRRAIAYDLTGLTEEQACAVLLTWGGAFHVMRARAKQYVVAPAALAERLRDLVPSGVTFIGEEEIAAHSPEIWRWIALDEERVLGWGAKPEDVILDRYWKDALDDRAPPTNEEPSAADTGARKDWTHFWHSVAWDPLSKRILADLRASATLGTRLATAQSIYVVAAARRDRLELPLTNLFAESAVADIDTVETFLEVLVRVASGNLRRLVMTENRHPVRVAMLAELCGIRGVEYVGPIGAGGLSLGRIGERVLRETHQQFEQQWRLSRDEKAPPLRAPSGGRPRRIVAAAAATR